LGYFFVLRTLNDALRRRTLSKNEGGKVGYYCDKTADECLVSPLVVATGGDAITITEGFLELKMNEVIRDGNVLMTCSHLGSWDRKKFHDNARCVGSASLRRALHRAKNLNWHTSIRYYRISRC
jgi:hypothetical protein